MKVKSSIFQNYRSGIVFPCFSHTEGQKSKLQLTSDMVRIKYKTIFGQSLVTQFSSRDGFEYLRLL